MKRVLSLVLALVLVLGMIPTFAADMTAGQHLYEHEFIAGVGNGELNEAGLLTREQLAKLILELNGSKEEAEVLTLPPSYTDSAKISAWARPYVAYAQIEGLMVGFTDGSFRPQAGVSGQQLAQVLTRALGYEFSWATVVADAADLGIDVATGAALTRGEAFEAMWVTVNTMPKGETKLTLGQKLGKLDPPAPEVAFAVESVKTVNNKQVEIKFTKAVNATEAVKLANYTFGLQGAVATNVVDGAGAKAAVLADGMTVLLTLENGANLVNSTTTNKLVVKKEIGLAADYTKADITALDVTIPGIESVKTTGPKQITITFTEPMDRSVTAANTVSSFTLNNGTVTLDPTKATYVDADRTLTLETYITIPEAEHTLTVKAPASNNMKDYAGYQLPATSIAFTHVKDTTAPTATLVSNTETTATIKFNKVVSNVNNANVLFRHTYNSATYQVAGADAGAVTNPSGDGMTYVINFTTAKPFPPGASTLFVAYNSATGTMIEDNYGNDFAATSFALNTVVDATKPEVVSVTFKSATSLEVLFSETVNEASAETLANYVLKDTATTPATITVSNAVLGSDNKTVTLTTGTMNGGNYNLTVKNVKDASLAANTMAEVTIAVVATDTIPPTVVDKDAAPGIQVQQVAALKVRVQFSEAMDKASIENKANWKYNGLPLTSGATVVADADNKAVVITLEALNVANDLTLGVVKDASGLSIASFATTLDIIATVNVDIVKAEVIAKNQIVAYFDELIVGSTTADFMVSLDNGGTWAAPTAISVALVDGKTQITLTPSADITNTAVNGGATVKIKTVDALAADGAAANSKNAFGTPVEFGAETALDKFVPSLVASDSVQTMDVDGDGYIDHIKVTFTELMQAGTVSVDKFTVAGYTAVDAYASTTAPTSATARTGATVADSAVVYVRVTEKTTFDGAVKPALSIAAGLKDVPGNAFAAVSEKASVDKVAPIVTATAVIGTKTATFTFSEPVYTNNAAPLTDVVIGDFTVNDLLAATIGAPTLTVNAEKTVVTIVFAGTVEATDNVVLDAADVYDAAGNVVATATATF